MERKPAARLRKLTFAERWFHDGLLISNQPAFHQTIEVDLTRLAALLKTAQEHGTRLTYTHVLVRAAALALAAHPALHAILAGNRVYYPSQVDIALSISADTSVVPLLVIEGADKKPLRAIAEEIARRAPEVQAAHRNLFATLDRWGWIAPFGAFRRALLRLMFRSFTFRQRGSGTFQVSLVPGVDKAATSLFSTTAILIGGEVKERVIAADGVPAVRPTIHLTVSADHRLWNGRDGQTFLRAVRDIMLGVDLEKEISLPS
jgi:pyruvate/2-oxoglutarate dehydrogenase complex dihydrolipoamide acyltransferase (E2) component